MQNNLQRRKGGASDDVPPFKIKGIFHSRVSWRYWEGVTCSHFLKVIQKLLSLLNPVLKAMSLMEVSVDFSRYLAADKRVLIMY